MRVLHLNAGNLYGGVETFLTTLARSQRLCPAMESSFGVCFPGRFLEELEFASAPVFRLGEVQFSRPWSVWTARRRLARLLRRERFDVAVCHMSWSHAVFAPVLASLGIPFVHWAHGITAGRYWLERLAGRTRPRAVICNSQATAESVPNLFASAPIHVIRCAVEVGRKASDDRLTVRQEFAAEPDQAVLIQVSRMEAWKGHETLLGALAKLPQGARWTCWIVGGAQRPAEREYLAKLQDTVRAFRLSDRVRFLGHRSDVRRLLAAADIFCQPNREAEPFGLVFIEALAAGLPVVGTAIGGAREIVTPACGELVTPADEAALALSLARMIEDPAYRVRLGRTGPERARQLCDPGQQMNLMAETFRQVAA